MDFGEIVWDKELYLWLPMWRVPLTQIFSPTTVSHPIRKRVKLTFIGPGLPTSQSYVITRVWVGTTLLASKVGPPPVPSIRNGNTYATYCFYVVNLPNAGVLTLEFTNPATNVVVHSNVCYYSEVSNLKTGISPNPVNADQGILNIAMDGIDNEMPFHIHIYTIDGRLLQSNEVTLHNGKNLFGLDTKTLKNDLVFISISHPEMGVIQRQKLIVKH